MPIVARVIKIDCDPTENYPVIRHISVATFLPDEKLTAYGRASQHLRDLDPPKLYVAHGQVYPQWTIAQDIGI